VRILALDTATESCSAALLADGHVITREQRLERGHAGRILPMVDELLAEAGLTLGALNAIAFGRGPGAFTGVRLAASVTQGLAFGAGLPVVPISDLRALAQRALEAEPAATGVLACTDARMREVYWGWYVRQEQLAVLVGDERLGSPDGVSLPEAWLGHGSICGAGPGFDAYPQLRRGVGAALGSVRAELLPRAAEIARLAAPEVAQGRIFPAEQALPVYLRDDVVHMPHA
jgi:tRNA threonylcarbamoyladenosine biosynthesis protein TsaB